MKTGLIVIFLFLCVNAGAQTNLYVDGSRSASGAGTSWSAAYKTLNEALSVANAGSVSTAYVIHIATGAYVPTGTSASTNRDSTFLITRPRIKIYGGYPASGGTRNATTNPTVLSGGISSTPSYHVLVFAGSFSTSNDSVEIDGVIIEGADGLGATGFYTYNGVGIYRGIGAIVVQSFPAKILLNNCSVSNNGSGAMALGGGHLITKNSLWSQNLTDYVGGAIESNYSVIEAFDCSFSDNAAWWGGSGGAIQASACTLRLNNCSFSNNGVYGAGGAVSTMGGKLIASNCLFTDNIAYGMDTGPYEGGGAINIYGGTDSIENCTFLRNVCGTYGGGVNAYDGPTYINNCIFKDNRGFDGGGCTINNYSSAPTSPLPAIVKNSFFSGNKAGFTGGGLCVLSLPANPAIVTNCDFVADTASSGGGVAAWHAVTMDRCRFAGNIATQGGGLMLYDTANRIAHLVSNSVVTGNKGGGVYINRCSPTLVNCTVSGNVAATGYGISVVGTSSAIARATIKNCIVWDGNNSLVKASTASDTVTYSIVGRASGVHTGAGNMNANPLFVAPLSSSALPDSGGNYRLLPCSPAINAGLNATVVGSLDMADSARIFAGTVDMGAYEFRGTTISLPATPTGRDSVCVNDTIRLSHTTSGGVWSSSNPTIATVNTSGVVTGIAAGVALIGYTVSGFPGCSTGVKSVTINPLPSVVIAGDTTLCVSDSTIFSAAPTGGTWSSSNTSIATVSSAGVVRAVVSGMATISYTVTNSGGCTATASKIVTINAYPAITAISGRDSICVHDTTILTNAATGGSWTSVMPWIATVSNTGTVTPLFTGTVTINYSVSNNWCMSTASKLITILPGYDLADSITICQGTRYNFGGLSLTAAGTYTHLFSTIKGCDSNVTLTLSVDTMNLQVTQTGAQLTAAQAGATYQWIDCRNGNTPIAGQTSQTFNAAANGQYAVIITLRSCSDTSDCMTVTGLRIGNPRVVTNGIELYPDPASDMITVKATGTQLPTYILLRDMTGKQLQRVAAVTATTTLNLSSYASGVYTVETHYPSGRLIRRVNIVR